MSHLLKALKSLETRGAAFAPAAKNTAQPPAGLTLPTEHQALETAISPEECPVKVKPRLATRVRPRRAVQPPVDPIAPRPLMETLQELPQPVAKNAQPANKNTAPTETASPLRKSGAGIPQGEQYALAPAIVVNQAALDAGAALARELAVEEVAGASWSDEEYPAAPHREGHALRSPAPARAAIASPHPARSATLFEHRIRETLMHPARSRPFADLVQRLRQDFRGSQERSLLFTGIGLASRGDEMLAHVAALFAEQGERVLLVDADFERAGLTAGFGAGTLGGLQNALVAPRNWRDHLLPTSFANLSFLPTGRGNLNVDSASATLTSILPQLESEFPLVLIDGGQSSGSILMPLARSCDATYFVIRLGTTDAKEAQGALKNFRAAGARVMGCVAVMEND